MKTLILITLLITSLNTLADTLTPTTTPNDATKSEYLDCTKFEMIEHCIDGFCYCSKEEE